MCIKKNALYKITGTWYDLAFLLSVWVVISNTSIILRYKLQGLVDLWVMGIYFGMIDL